MISAMIEVMVIQLASSYLKQLNQNISKFERKDENIYDIHVNELI